MQNPGRTRGGRQGLRPHLEGRPRPLRHPPPAPPPASPTPCTPGQPGGTGGPSAAEDKLLHLPPGPSLGRDCVVRRVLQGLSPPSRAFPKGRGPEPGAMGQDTRRDTRPGTAAASQRLPGQGRAQGCPACPRAMGPGSRHHAERATSDQTGHRAPEPAQAEPAGGGGQRLSPRGVGSRGGKLLGPSKPVLHPKCPTQEGPARPLTQWALNGQADSPWLPPCTSEHPPCPTPSCVVSPRPSLPPPRPCPTTLPSAWLLGAHPGSSPDPQLQACAHTFPFLTRSASRILLHGGPLGGSAC
ncbi:hypothetical protein VULLAG_LOCUS23769 [Vulpes lagopus]